MFTCIVDAYAWAGDDLLFFWANDPIFDPDRGLIEGKTVLFDVDTESLTDGPWAICEGFIDFFLISSAKHFVDAKLRFYSAYKDGIGNIFDVCDDIEEEVDAVAHVDVADAAGLVHGCSSFCAAVPEGMGGLVVDPLIGFCFNDHSPC